jgi:segregation and condensation protein B
MLPVMNDESNEGGVLVTEKDLSEETQTPDSPEASDPINAEEVAEEIASPEEAPVSFGAGEALSDKELDRRLLVLIYASPEPLTNRRLTKLLESPDPKRVAASLSRVQEQFSSTELPLELKKIAGGWRILTAEDLDGVVGELVASRRTERMSPASLETLAVVAYRQPVTKAEIEAIRGVNAGPMIRSLVDRGLVKVVGRAKQPGSPLQYGSTTDFLDRFGLGSLKDLPRDDELARD